MTTKLTRKGDGARKVLDKIQSEISAARHALEETEAAALPLDEARAKLVSKLSSAVEQYATGVTFGQFANPDPREGSIPSEEITWRDVAWLMGPEKLADAIMARVDVRSGRPPALPMKERIAKLDTLRTKLDELERAEEVETLRLEAAGHEILRRGDIRPEIVFAVWAEVAA